MSLATALPADTESRDFRDPEVRLETLFDPGTLRSLTGGPHLPGTGGLHLPGTGGRPVNDRSGAMPARGTINGGPDTHGRRSGVVHVVADTDDEAVERARAIAALLARPGRYDIPGIAYRENPARLLPENAKRAYDVHPLIEDLLDGEPVELHARFAPNVVTALGRLAGRTVGVIANNPLRLGGCLDSASPEQAARFVRMCDAFGVPLVPRVTLVTRKAYGGAYIAMNSRSLGATAVFAWPTAEVAVMGASAAVNILHRKKLAAAAPEERDALRAKLVEEQL